MDKIVFASSNIDKFNEIILFFRKLKTKIYLPKDFKIFNEPNESGKTFAENAKIKSSFGYQKTLIPCFADDSGICIEALNWGPGIKSKRFLDKFKNKKNCLEFIIDKTRKTKKNKAFFQTSICLTLKENYHIVFEGKLRGTISKQILGKHGFGYDPIFIPNKEIKTLAQMNKYQKNEISHRSVAITKLVNFLYY